MYQTHFPINITLTDNNQLYVAGPISITLTVANGPLADEDFRFVVTDEHGYPMCATKEGTPDVIDDPEVLRLLCPAGVYTPDVHRKNGIVEARIDCRRVWLPGRYKLLAFGLGSRYLLRFDFELDQQLRVTHGVQGFMAPSSTDDMLAQTYNSNQDKWVSLSEEPGSRQLCDQVVRYAQLTTLNDHRTEKGQGKLMDSRHFLMGTPSFERLRPMLFPFASLMLMPQVEVVDAGTLYDSTAGQPYEKLTELCEYSSQRTLCLYNLSVLTGAGGKQIVRRISEKVRDDVFCLILCGTEQELATVLDVFPSLRTLWPGCRSSNPKEFGPHYLQVERATALEAVNAFFTRVTAYGLDFHRSACDTLARRLAQACADDTVAHWGLADYNRYIEEHIKQPYMKHLLSLIQQGETLPGEVPLVDVDMMPISSRTSEYDEAIRDLNEMVGLDDVKHALTTTANRMRFFGERRRLGLATTDDTPFHAIFTGSPGTGKTTVARMLGRIYHSLGLLSKGDVVCVDRTRMIGRFIGETEENMKHILEEARGNVLFVDEAYTLYTNPTSNDFGRNALECLLTVLSQKRPDMLIIFAGYEKEMDSLMSMNPGLVGRFPFKYRFADYTAPQLMQIAERLLSRDEYVLADEARERMQQTIAETVAQRTRNFGNARWVEQYVEGGIIPALADRLAAQPTHLHPTAMPAHRVGRRGTGLPPFQSSQHRAEAPRRRGLQRLAAGG